MTKPKYTPEERKRVKAELLAKNVAKGKARGFTKRISDRDLAIKEGRKWYVGSAHHCGCKIRYVINSSCKYCADKKARHKLYDGTIDAYNSKSTPRRRERIRNQSPPLTLQEQSTIISLYHFAKFWGEVTGVRYEIDHVRPIAKGGAHHPDNLQILSRDDNRQKGCSYY